MVRCRCEDCGASHKILRGCSREFFFGGFDLGDGDVAGFFDELSELGVGDLGFVHPKPIDVDAVDGNSVVGDPW
jgi:hypothetical protein